MSTDTILAKLFGTPPTPPLPLRDRLAGPPLPAEGRLAGHMRLIMSMDDWSREARENTRDHVLAALDEARMDGVKATIEWLRAIPRYELPTDDPEVFDVGWISHHEAACLLEELVASMTAETATPEPAP